VNVQAAAEPPRPEEKYGELGRLAELDKPTPPFQVGTYKAQMMALLPSKLRHEFIVQLFRAGDLPEQAKTRGSIGIIVIFGGDNLSARVKFVRYGAGVSVVEDHEVYYRFQSMTVRAIVKGIEDIFTSTDDLGGIGAQLRGEIQAASEPANATPYQVFADLIKLIEKRHSLTVRTKTDAVTLTAPADAEIHALAHNHLFYVSLSGDKKHVRVYRSGVGEAQSLTKCPENARDLAAAIARACLSDASELVMGAAEAEAAAEPAQDYREALCRRIKAKLNLHLEPSKITYMGRDGIDYDGNVNWKSKNLTRIPVRFRKVTGYFSCSHNHLTTLEHAPGHVGRDFYCCDNHLTTLAGAPGHVDGDFYCYHNHLTTLAGAPGHVDGDFYCYHNHLPPDTKKPKGVKGKFVPGEQTPAPVHGAVEPASTPRGWLAMIHASEKSEIDFVVKAEATKHEHPETYSVYVTQPIYSRDISAEERELIAEVRHNYGRGSAGTKDVLMKLVQHHGVWMCSCKIGKVEHTARIPDTNNTQACVTAILVGVGVIPRDVLPKRAQAAAEPAANPEEEQIRKIIDIIFALESGLLRGSALRAGKLPCLGKLDSLALPRIQHGQAFGYYELCVEVSAFLHVHETDPAPMQHLRYRVSWHQDRYQSLSNPIPEKLVVDIYNMAEDNSTRKPVSVPMPKLPAQFLHLPVAEAAKVVIRASIQLVENIVGQTAQAAAEPDSRSLLLQPADAMGQFRILHRIWKEKGGDTKVAQDRATGMLLTTGDGDEIPTEEDTKADVRFYSGRQATPEERQEHGSDYFDYASLRVEFPRSTQTRRLHVKFYVWDNNVHGNDFFMNVLGKNTAETMKLILAEVHKRCKEK